MSKFLKGSNFLSQSNAPSDLHEKEHTISDERITRKKKEHAFSNFRA